MAVFVNGEKIGKEGSLIGEKIGKRITSELYVPIFKNEF